MRVNADRPRRELAHSAVEREFDLTFLDLTVWLSGGMRRDGTIRHRQLTTRYLVQVPTDREGRPLAGVLNLVKPGGEVYEVTAAGACTCRDEKFKGRERY